MLRRTDAQLRTDCQTLAALSNPFHPPESQSVLETVGGAQDELLALADLNRIFLSLYENLRPYERALPADFWNRLSTQARLRRSVRSVFDKELARIAVLLKARNIRWILIKTVRSFPREIRDIDILVLDDSSAQLQEELETIGYEVSEKRSGFKMGLKAYRTFEGSMRVPVSIDVHSRLGYEGLTFVDEEDMWGSRRAWVCNGEKVAIPSPEHQLLALILNSFFGDGGLRLSDVFEAESLLNGGVDVKNVFGEASRYGWTKSAHAVLSSCRSASRSLGLSPYGNTQELGLPPTLPSYFGLGTLAVGLLEKLFHDFSLGGPMFLSSWVRLSMKYASSLSRDRLSRDSWNQIFQR